MPSDVGLGVCSMAAAYANQLPAPSLVSSTSCPSNKIPGGIAKKAIDKQSRKDRNGRYSQLLHAKPTGSQGKLKRN